MSLSAVLLAGGESRRMGSDKATFVFRGKPLWQVQLETLQKLRPKEIFVSARIDPTVATARMSFSSQMFHHHAGRSAVSPHP